MSNLTSEQVAAAQEFANATMANLQMGRGVHPPTVVAASARMAGTYLFRSFPFPLTGVKPGQVVLSNEANQQTPLLIQRVAGILSRSGIQLAEHPPAAASEAKNKPALDFLHTQKKLEPVFAPIKAKFGLSGPEAAHAIAAAAALLIRHCGQVLDPNVGFAIAVYGIIEGAKTAPDPVEVDN
jgi:hypothetical protein